MITPEELRKCAMCVHLAAESGHADDISNHLTQAADAIAALRSELENEKLLYKSLAEHVGAHEGELKQTIETLKSLVQELLYPTAKTSTEQVIAELKAALEEKP